MKIRLILAFLLYVCFINDSFSYDLRREIPIRFNFKPDNTENIDSKTPSIPLGIAKIYAYATAGETPFMFSIPAKLVIECQSNQVYYGNNAVPCRVWLESEDDPDVYELSSNFGLSFGVKGEDTIFGSELFNKGIDFAILIKSHGKMPLGNKYLCGMDTLQAISFPIGELIPENAEGFMKQVKNLLDTAETMDVDINFLSLSLASEIVIEGKKVSFFIEGREIALTGFRDPTLYPDPSSDPNVKNFTLSVPEWSELIYYPNYYVVIDEYSNIESMMYSPDVSFVFDAYYTIGYQFTLIPGLTFNVFPSLVDRGSNPFTYNCPDANTLHNPGYYGKSLENAGVSSNKTISFALPITGTPDLPDVSVVDVIVNDIPGNDRTFSNEYTKIDFKIKNIGNRGTQGPPENEEPKFVFTIKVDGQIANDINGNPIQFRKLNNEWLNIYNTAPPVKLNVNDEFIIRGFIQNLSEGRHTIEFIIGYLEYATTVNQEKIYRIGDINRDNNRIVHQLYVGPQRGTVIGRIITNPCSGDCGVNGIKVCLRNISGGNYTECLLSGHDDIYGEGIYRFTGVPTGDYALDYKPKIPTPEELANGEPFYEPYIYYFHHDSNNTDNFLQSGGLRFLRQYQILKGKVVDNNFNPISGARVRIGEIGKESFTDSSGEFMIENLQNGKEYNLYIIHPAYKTKILSFRLSSEITEQRETIITNGQYCYYDSDFTECQRGWIRMFADTVAPSIEINPLPNEGYVSKVLKIFFKSYDFDKETLKYSYNLYDESNNLIYKSGVNNYVPNTSDGYVAIKYVFSALNPDGNYSIEIQVLDASGNSTTKKVFFKKDTTKPNFIVTLRDSQTGSTSFTSRKHVDVGISITNQEPDKLKLYLSNDNTNWTLIDQFIGNTYIVKNWEIVKEDVFNGTKTVYVKIDDLAHNSTSSFASINVTTNGAITLADGKYYFNSLTNVPLLIDITPPDGALLIWEYGAGEEVQIGNSANSKYLAQKIVLSETTTFNFIKFYIGSVVGSPSPLNIKLVKSLNNNDPSSSNPANNLASWSFSYDIVENENLKKGYLSLYLENPNTLYAGTYYLLIYTDSVDENNYYIKPTGYYSMMAPNPTDHLRYDYINGIWKEVYDLPDNPTYIPTLSYEMWYNPPGEVKIAKDGNCDNTLWNFEVHTPKIPKLLNFNSVGEKVVCVEYRNQVNNSKDGRYYGSFILDINAPSGQLINYSVDKINKTYTFNFDASDDLSGIELIKFYLPNQVGFLQFMQSQSIVIDQRNYLFNEILKTNKIDFVFIDRAGNESSKSTINFSIEDDINPPVVSALLNGGNLYTTIPQINISINVNDNISLSAIFIKDMNSQRIWRIPEAGDLEKSIYSGSIQIDLPKVNINGIESVLDGRYDFEVYAIDMAGNRSLTHNIYVYLDRAKPVITKIKLLSLKNETFLRDTNEMKLELELDNDLTPMFMRYRFLPNGNWNDFAPVNSGLKSYEITGILPLPSSYDLEVEVKDSADNKTTKTASIKVNRRPLQPLIYNPIGEVFQKTPPFDLSYIDPDNDPFNGAVFLVRNANDYSIKTITDFVNKPYYFQEGFFEYDKEYFVTGYVRDSYGLTSPYSVMKSFVIARPLLTVISVGDGLGEIRSSDDKINCSNLSNDCSEKYDYNQSVNLNATPLVGSVFKGWDGDCKVCGTNAFCFVEMQRHKTCIARFDPIGGKYGLFISKSGNGSGFVKSNPSGINCGDTCEYIFDYKTEVELIPIAGTGSIFVRWDGDEDCLDGNVTMNKNLFCTAIFDSIPAGSSGLFISKFGKGNGIVTSIPSGISCGNDCSEIYINNTNITLIVESFSDSEFDGWDGDCSGMEKTISFPLNSSKHCITKFRKVITINNGAKVTSSTKVRIDLDYPAGQKMTFFTGKNWTAEEDFKNYKDLTIAGGDGLKEIYVRILNGSNGLWYEYKSSIYLDTRPPVGNVIINNGASITNSLDVILNLFVVDYQEYENLEMRFSNDKTIWSEWEPFRQTRFYTLPDGIGKKYVYVQFRDGGLKTSQVYSANIYYNPNIPSSFLSTITINNDEPFTNKTGVILNINTPDPSYNLMSISQDLIKWSAWTNVVSPKNISLTGQDGIKNVYIKFKKSDGTESPIYYDSIILDRKKPAGTIQINGGAYITNNTDVKVYIHAVDELSGIDYIEISSDNVNWTNIGDVNTANITLTTGDGVKKVYMRIRDKAGNISSTIIDTIILDTTPPVGKITISKQTTTPDPRDVKLTLSAAGAVWMKLSYDGGVTYESWESYKTTKILTLPEGENTISVIFKDLAGNESVPVSATVTIP